QAVVPHTVRLRVHAKTQTPTTVLRPGVVFVAADNSIRDHVNHGGHQNERPCEPDRRESRSKFRRTTAQNAIVSHRNKSSSGQLCSSAAVPTAIAMAGNRRNTVAA